MGRQVIRHEDTNVAIYVDGKEAANLSVRNWTARSRVTIDRAKYQGRTTPSLDATFDGWEGDFTVNLVNGSADLAELNETYLDAIRERVASGVIQIVENYVDPNSGELKTSRYDNCQVTFSKSSNMDDRVEQAISWQAEDGGLI